MWIGYSPDVANGDLKRRKSRTEFRFRSCACSDWDHISKFTSVSDLEPHIKVGKNLIWEDQIPWHACCSHCHETIRCGSPRREINQTGATEACCGNVAWALRVSSSSGMKLQIQGHFFNFLYLRQMWGSISLPAHLLWWWQPEFSQLVEAAGSNRKL